MVEQPSLHSAVTDGNGPTKRRRRPALSCVECRLRKVRCDREKPCGACTKIKSSTCSYRPGRAGIRSHGERSPEVATASTSGNNEHSQHENLTRSSPEPFVSSSKVGSTINRYVTPGLFGEHGHPRLKPLPTERSNSDLSSQSGSRDTSIINSLLDKINSLESKLAATTLNEQPKSGTPPFREGPSATFVKSKFYGQSHWMNAVEPYDALGDTNTTVNPNTNRKEVNKSTELYGAVSEVKGIGRIIKTARMLQPYIPVELHDSIPRKEVCDLLIECYLRTFESVFRVLHIPTFRREYEGYWSGTIPAKPSVVLKILLVCAVGAPFYTGPDQARLRSSSAKWIQAATEWSCAPHAKSRLNMAGLQIQILTLLARQVCHVEGDHIWIPAGSLLRTAMHLGLHRDPSHFSKISIYHGEMRRRLWATVLEITAQSSLDMGMPPMVSAEDYDTESPANVNDEEIEEGSDTPLNKKPPTVFTDSSIQIACTQTLSIRLKIIRLLNSLRFDLAYNDVLRLGSELTRICREKTMFFKSAFAANCNITPFQIKLSDSLVRRFVLCLHWPYFSKANEDPQYHYSRKMCLDTSLAIYAPATELLPGEEDDWTRMTHRSVGFCKSFFLYAMSTVYFELNSQIKERQEDSTLFTPLISTSSTLSTQPLSLPAQFQTLRGVLAWSLEMTVARIHNGETNAKGVVFLACALARIDALVSGGDAESAVLEAAKKSTKEMRQIMVEVYREEHGEDINFNLPNVSLAGKDHGRGEGADDVTGKYLQTGTNVNNKPDGELPTLDRNIVGLDMLDGLGNISMDMDLDLNAYMQGQPMDTGNGYHFGRSPEWFYDLNGWAAGNDGMGFNGYPT